MTVHQLMKEVASLGFADSVADVSGFFFCANRALATLCAERPSVRSLDIRKVTVLPDPDPAEPPPTGACAPGEDLILTAASVGNDCLAFDRLPVSPDGLAIPGAVAEPESIRVPAAYDGIVRVFFRVRPPLLTPDDPAAAIPVSPSAEHLLPLLTAAYFWMDDEPEKAKIYLALYQTGMQTLLASDMTRSDTFYGDVNRWA